MKIILAWLLLAGTAQAYSIDQLANAIYLAEGGTLTRWPPVFLTDKRLNAQQKGLPC